MGDQLKEEKIEKMDTGEWVKPCDFGGSFNLYSVEESIPKQLESP